MPTTTRRSTTSSCSRTTSTGSTRTSVRSTSTLSTYSRGEGLSSTLRGSLVVAGASVELSAGSADASVELSAGHGGCERELSALDRA
eukprot:843650-Heterocapsa_arctica.AAC.1